MKQQRCPRTALGLMHVAHDDHVITSLMDCVTCTVEPRKAALDQWCAMGICRPIEIAKRAFVACETIAAIALIRAQNMDCKPIRSIEFCKAFG